MDSIGNYLLNDHLNKKCFYQLEDTRQLNDFKRFYESSSQLESKPLIVSSSDTVGIDIINRKANVKEESTSLIFSSDKSTWRRSIIYDFSNQSFKYANTNTNTNSSSNLTNNQFINDVKNKISNTYKPVQPQGKQKFELDDFKVTLQTKGEITLIVRGYKKGTENIVNWFISKTSSILSSVVINGKKTFFKIGR